MMLQPTKDVLREQLALAAETMIRQREEIDRMWEANRFLQHVLLMSTRRWWHRLMWWRK